MAETDCGAACLAMISSANGGAGSLKFWRDALSSGRNGVSIAHLIRTASANGLRARAFGIGDDLGTVLRGTDLPAVLHVDGNHFVVVTAISRHHVIIVDPRMGKHRIRLDKLTERDIGAIVVFARGGPIRDSFQPSQFALSGLIWRSLRGLRLQLVSATALMTVATLVPAALIQRTVDQVIQPTTEFGAPPLFLAITAGCLAIQFLSSLLQSGLVLRLKTRIDLRLMATFVRSLLSRDFAFLEARATGDVMSRIASNTALQKSLTSLLLSGGLFLPLTIIYLVALAATSGYLTTLPIAGALLLVALSRFFGTRIESAQRESLRADSELAMQSIDATSNYAIIKSMNLESDVTNQWMAAFSKSLASGLRRDSRIQWSLSGATVIQVAIPVLVVFAGAALYADGLIQLGAVFAMVTLTGIFLGNVGRLTGSMQDIYLIRAHLERLSDIIELETESREETPPPRRRITRNDGPIVSMRARIVLDDVCFRYDEGSDDVLRGLSLTIEPGDMVGLGGPTGCGKTTLANVLLGLYEPTAGRLVRQAVGEGRDPGYGEIRRAYIPQDPELFTGTVRDNVLAWRQNIADSAVWDVLETVALRGDVEKMPLGLDTPIGNRGIHLSGGQRQRLAIARALLGSPGLLIGDEPTSHLDPGTETVVLEALRSLSCTRVVIAHSDTVLRACDRTLVMANGELAYGGRSHADSIRPVSTATASRERD
ncbi:MAG: peptidase domain-containing ABC transporter [Kutzneria sp.]|nr:peptidase domain-containing ABC transporter [Kutzneria sp.]